MAKYPTTWNLKLLYKSDTDPQIEKDMRAIERAYAAFEKKYKGKDFTSSASKLKLALDDADKLEKVSNGAKPYAYFKFQQDTDSQNKVVQAKAAQYYQRFIQATNLVAFFALKLGEVPAKEQKKLLSSPLLKGYSYYLKKIFAQSRYNLSEGEEQLANLLYQPGGKMWTDGQTKLLNQQTVLHKGKPIPLTEAVSVLLELPKAERHALYERINEACEAVSHFAEAEVNGLFTFKKVMDERRGFKAPYSSTVLNYENEDNEVEQLVALITRYFAISHRFYKAHARLLGEKKITPADRNVKIGEINKRFDWQTSLSLVRQAFAKVDPKYPAILDQYVKNGQFDIYPRVGKRGGAYCSSGGDRPVFVFLNHTDTLRSYETIAHEMGHAFHAEFCRAQPYHYRDVSIATAEVASTFFEQVALDELEGVLDAKDYCTLLHNKILGDVSTIFAQAAFFNAELEMHERVRREGFVPKEELARIMAKHMRSYLGPVTEVADKHGYFFVRLPHLRYSFYVYTYAYGQLVSKALFEKWKEDPAYIKKIEKFLAAGSSMSPKDIFKSIGIDTSDPKFFEAGLKVIERDIAKLEKLTQKKG